MSAADVGPTADCMLDSQMAAVASRLQDTVAQTCGLLAPGGIQALLPACTTPRRTERAAPATSASSRGELVAIAASTA